MILNVVHVFHEQSLVVAHKKKAAYAEVDMLCCQIFFKYTDTYTPSEQKQCTLVLHNDLATSKLNRCERAKIITDTLEIWLIMTHVWHHFFTFSGQPLYVLVGSYIFSMLSTYAPWLVMKFVQPV